MDILDEIGKYHTLNKQGVNIGAGTALSFIYDPTYDAFTTMNYSGMLIDSDESHLSYLKDILNPYIEFKISLVTPNNINDLVFNDSNITIDLDLFKIDIDSYDYSILETFLSIAKPKVIIFEINPIFKPPIVFIQHYHSSSNIIRDGPYYGSSLQAIYLLGKHKGYTIIQLQYWDLILVRNEYAYLFPVTDIYDLWFNYYLHTLLISMIRNGKCESLRNQEIGNLYNKKMEDWIDGIDKEIVKDINHTLYSRSLFNSHMINWTLSIE
jgi:hypothetical protein